MLRRVLQRFSKQAVSQEEPAKSEKWNDSSESATFVRKIRRQYRLREAIYDHIWILR